MALLRPLNILNNSRNLENFNLFILYTEIIKLLYLIISSVKTSFLYYLITGFIINSLKLFLLKLEYKRKFPGRDSEETG